MLFCHTRVATDTCTARNRALRVSELVSPCILNTVQTSIKSTVLGEKISAVQLDLLIKSNVMMKVTVKITK